MRNGGDRAKAEKKKKIKRKDTVMKLLSEMLTLILRLRQVRHPVLVRRLIS
jgi:hypothetical protein